MTNNDCLRRLRYILDKDDAAMTAVFSLAGQTVTREEIASMLRKDEAEGFSECTDVCFTGFLDGLIIEKRGVKDDGAPATQSASPDESSLNNNIIFKKLRIAFDLKAEDILEILSLADCQISKHELSAFFRKPSTRQYRACKDQVLRNFLAGLQHQYRGAAPTENLWGKA